MQNLIRSTFVLMKKCDGHPSNLRRRNVADVLAFYGIRINSHLDVFTVEISKEVQRLTSSFATASAMIDRMNFSCSIVLTIVLLLCYHCVLLPPTQQAEQTLIAALLSDYNKDIRPTDQVSVEITAALQQIVSLDEKQQIMTSSSFISQKWLDERLSWTPNSTNNYLTVVMLPVSELWTPDLMIVNSADADGYLTVSDFSLASINNHGQVYMLLPALVVKTRCPLFLQKFPFDRQVCTINLTTWGQGANRIALTKKNDAVVDTSQYNEHPIWQLNGTSMAEVHSSDRSPFEDTYNSIISVELYLKRKPLFFMMNGIFACLILNCVTLVSYALPFGSQIGLCEYHLVFVSDNVDALPSLKV